MRDDMGSYPEFKSKSFIRRLSVVNLIFQFWFCIFLLFSSVPVYKIDLVDYVVVVG